MGSEQSGDFQQFAQGIIDARAYSFAAPVPGAANRRRLTSFTRSRRLGYLI